MAFSGYQDLSPDFARNLQAMIAANPGISPYSGYRSIERQRQLYEASGQNRHMVAPPGHSQHNFGNAVDLHYADDAARQWAHDNAQKYGLTFPMAWENWHIEPIGARSANAAQSQTQPGQPTQAPAQKTPLPMPPTGPSSYMQAVMGGNQDWMQNQSYSTDALLGDVLAGHNPIRRYVYQQVMGMFA